MLKYIYKYSDLIFLACLLILIVLPSMWISIYNHPFADDFWLTNYLIENDKNPFKVAYLLYVGWTGAYSGFFIQALLQPTSIIGFKIIPIILIALYLASFYYILHVFAGNKLSVKEKIIGCLILYALFFSYMSGVSQGIYWVMASIAYTFGYWLLVLLIGFTVNLLREQFAFASFNKHFLLTLFICFVTVGANSNTAILSVGYVCVLVVYTYFYHKKLLPYVSVLFLFSLLCFCIVIISPGNEVRFKVQQTANYGLIESILSSLKLTFSFVSQWLNNGFFVLTTLLFIVVLIEKKLIAKPVIYPIFPILITFGVCYSWLFFPIKIVGQAGHRHMNMAYLYFILGWFVSIYYLISYIANKKFFTLPTIDNGLKKIVYLIGILLLLIHSPHYNQRMLYEDLFKGTAKRFDEEMYARYKKIEQEKAKGNKYIVFEKLHNRPYTLFTGDMKNDVNNYYNKDFAKYFGLDSVRVAQ
ncbi:MAG: hypothetical protein OHK0057_36710 [Thermoflexibacter sp.]